MTKQEFIHYLNQKLAVLSDEERQDIIDEYTQHIDMKVENGASEAEAIADFGDLNELVKEILDAYHLNRSHVDSNFIMEWIEKIGAGISAAAKSITKMKSDQLIQLIIELVILCLVLTVGSLIVKLIAGLFLTIVGFLPGFILSFISGILNLLYAILALFILYVYATSRVKNMQSQNEANSKDKDKSTVAASQSTSTTSSKPAWQIKKEREMKEAEERKAAKKKAVQPEVMQEETVESIAAERPAASAQSVHEEVIERINSRASNPSSNVGFLSRTLMGLVRFFVGLICFFPLVIVVTVFAVITGLLIIWLLMGLGSIGLTLIFLGLLVIFGGMAAAVGSFLFPKNRGYH
ncbi:MAG: DUF1700 domain-containing protein [Erysipelotrichaceae bacterium]|jgi:uncharacterized membrane protein|nr:DUF1700 domain-containing protein [Erysipelotrichaceae bacterium]